jgi:hypothetical protein
MLLAVGKNPSVQLKQAVLEEQLTQGATQVEQPPVTLSLYEPDGHSQVFDAVIGKRSGQVRQYVALPLQVAHVDEQLEQPPATFVLNQPSSQAHSPPVESGNMSMQL